MKIKALKNWMDIKTQRDFSIGRAYDVADNYGDKVVKIGHAELVKEEKPKKAKK